MLGFAPKQVCGALSKIDHRKDGQHLEGCAGGGSTFLPLALGLDPYLWFRTGGMEIYFFYFGISM